MESLADTSMVVSCLKFLAAKLQVDRVHSKFKYGRRAKFPKSLAEKCGFFFRAAERMLILCGKVGWA